MTKQLVVNDEHRFIKMEARTSAQLFKIYGWVKREEMAARKKGDKNGEVPIKNPYTGNLNLIKEMDKPIPIQNGFLVSFHAFYFCETPLLSNLRSVTYLTCILSKN